MLGEVEEVMGAEEGADFGEVSANTLGQNVAPNCWTSEDTTSVGHILHFLPKSLTAQFRNGAYRLC